MRVFNLIKESYIGLYRHLGMVIFNSFLWFLMVGLLVPIISVGVQNQIYIVLLLAIFIGPVTAAVFYTTNKIINSFTVTWKDFFLGFKRYFWKSITITIILLLIIMVILVDFTFFLNSDYKILQYMSAIWIYLLLFLFMLMIYIFPLMIELDNLDRDYSIKDIFKYSVVLTMQETIYTLAVLINILIFSVLSIVIGIGMALLLMGGIALFANNATNAILIKHDIKEEVKELDNLKK